MKVSKQPFIKWTGSKRKQAPEIVSLFPKEIDTYYEPFLGGGSVLHELLNRISNKEITCKKIVCSDLNKDLISIWNLLKYDSDTLLKYYTENYNKLVEYSQIEDPSLPMSAEHVKNAQVLYYKNRDKLNSLSDDDPERPLLLYWIMRTCFNGLIRYNSKGQFNSPFHVAGRFGIRPDILSQVIDTWKNVLKDIDIVFLNESYEKVIKDAKEGDVVYMDPPYENVTGMYYTNTFNNQQMYNEIRKLSQKNVKWYLSYDGKSGDTDYTSNSIPDDLYKEHIYINSGHSSFKKLKSKSRGVDNKAIVYDSLYIG